MAGDVVGLLAPSATNWGSNGMPSASSTPSTLSGELLKRISGTEVDDASSSAHSAIHAPLLTPPAELSDDEEELECRVRRYFRVKRQDELDAVISGIADANAKKGRATRGTKGKPRKILKEVPFSDLRHRKLVPLSLQPGDIDDDLLAILGLTPGAFDARKKRKRGAGGDGSQCASDSEHSDRGAKKSRNEAPSGKLFVRHADKKGWVVCRRCAAAVWPPNCAKHAQNCDV